MSELLPCPFCGISPPKERSECIAPYGSHRNGHYHWVECSICGAAISKYHNSSAEAVAAWNRREAYEAAKSPTTSTPETSQPQGDTEAKNPKTVAANGIGKTDGNEGAGNDCDHPAEKVVPGPRVEARWGSHPTEVCTQCSSYRVGVSPASPWKPGPLNIKQNAVS
jgi:Lar family restriction alleviation protein